MTSLKRQTLATTLALGILAVPASAKIANDDGIPAPVSASSQSGPTSEGFDWADAGMGFGTAVGLGVLGGASLATSRRRRSAGERPI